MSITITFEKPKREHYYSHPDCPPRKRGDGCYGDCIDCYHIERDLYNSRKKRIEMNKHLEDANKR